MNRDPERFVTEEAHTRMFAIDPDLRDLFGVSMAAQHEAFHRAIHDVLEAIPAATGHTELVELLAQLGRDHRKYGVEPEHYHIMYSAPTGEFAELMAEYWDSETQQTISQAMMLVTGVMRGAAETATDPARWTADVVARNTGSPVTSPWSGSSRTRRCGSGPASTSRCRSRSGPRCGATSRCRSRPVLAGELESHVRAVKGGTVSSAIVGDTRVGDVWTFAQSYGTLHVDRVARSSWWPGGRASHRSAHCSSR